MKANAQQTTKQLLWKTRGWYKLLLPFIAAAVFVAAVCAYGAPAVQAAPTTTVDGVIYAIDESAGEAYATSAVKAQVPADLVIPASISYNGADYKVVSLNTMCLSDCTSLKSVTVSDGVTGLGNSPFINCSSLAKVVLPDSVTSIGNSCFATCSALTDVTLPKGLTSLGTSCFQSCSSLTSVEIPNGVTTLGQGCFANCSSLKSVEIPATATAVEASCFTSCTSLESIEIPAGVTSLGDMSFYNCSALKIVTIPAGVTSLGNICFAECGSLAEIVFEGDAVESCDANAFSGGPDGRKYIFEKGCPSALASVLGADACYYRAKFLGADGAVLDVQDLRAGESAVEPSADKVPQKDAAGNSFAGWDSDVWTRPVSDSGFAVTAVYKPSVAEATIDPIGEQVYDGAAKTPKPVVKLGGTTLSEGTDYTLSYKDNTKAGTAAVTITGKDNYTGAKTVTFKIVAKKSDSGDSDKKDDGKKDDSSGKTGADVWKRLAGGSALTTMKAVVNEGWKSSEWVVVATSEDYHDAPSASGLAGLLDAPVLLTPKDSLSKVTKNLIKNKKVKNVIVVGGEEAVSAKVFSQIEALGVSVKRVAGGTAASTARAVYREGLRHGGWGSDAILATSKTYQDALSIAPYAYAKKAPIFLTDLNKTTAGSSTVALTKKFDRTLVVGGEAAVAKSTEKQLKGAKRLAGGTAYGTCKAVAAFCLQNGMTASHMGVATGQSYQDALCGAALCGKANSVLVLADDKNSKNVNGVVAKNKKALQQSCYVFGGTQAVSAKVYSAVEAASK